MPPIISPKGCGMSAPPLDKQIPAIVSAHARLVRYSIELGSFIALGKFSITNLIDCDWLV